MLLMSIDDLNTSGCLDYKCSNSPTQHKHYWTDRKSDADSPRGQVWSLVGHVTGRHYSQILGTNVCGCHRVLKTSCFTPSQITTVQHAEGWGKRGEGGLGFKKELINNYCYQGSSGVLKIFKHGFKHFNMNLFIFVISLMCSIFGR